MTDWNWNVQRLIDFIERNLGGDLSLERVAQRLGYSRWWCTRQFSRVCGLSLRSYIRARRLSRGAVELRDSRRGILEVAMRNGFSSQEAFTRAFRQQWGIAPGAAFTPSSGYTIDASLPVWRRCRPRAGLRPSPLAGERPPDPGASVDQDDCLTAYF